jgi:hypothetical protein
MGYLAIAVGAFMALGIAMNLGEGFGALAYALALLFCAALPIPVEAAGEAALGGARAAAEGASDAAEAILKVLASLFDGV